MSVVSVTLAVRTNHPFRATPAELEAAETALRRHGFEVTQVRPRHLTVQASPEALLALLGRLDQSKDRYIAIHPVAGELSELFSHVEIASRRPSF